MNIIIDGQLIVSGGEMTTGEPIDGNVVKLNKIPTFLLANIEALTEVHAFLIHVPEITPSYVTAYNMLYPTIFQFGVSGTNITLSPTDMTSVSGTAVSDTFIVSYLTDVTPTILYQNTIPYMSFIYVLETQSFLCVPYMLTTTNATPNAFVFDTVVWKYGVNQSMVFPQKRFIIYNIPSPSVDPDPEPPVYDTNDFLTTTQINEVLGAGGTGAAFKKKSELIDLGADETLMTSFGVNDFIPGKYINAGTYTTVYDTIYALRSGVINFSLFDGNNSSEDPAIGYVFDGENMNNAQFDAGFEGGGRKRKAWKAGNGNYIRLNSRATTTVTSNLTISIVFKQTSANSGVTGLFGGVIYGNGHWGLGYGCGWRPTQQSNKIGFEVYSGTGNNDGAATICYSSVAPELNKWYHLIVNAHLAGGYIYMYMWLNGVKTSGYSSGHNTTIGYQSLVDQTQTNKICLGRVQQSGWNLFRGMIQDFVIWNRVLSDSDVQKIINYYKGQGMF